MSGIYIHIPFCKRKCYYCDFYSSANLNQKMGFVDALNKEMELQKQYLNQEKISTVYFGGGTPSLLSIDDINAIFGSLKNNFFIQKNAEISIELNPDDITVLFAESLIKSGFNRVSVGIQSFSDEDLKLLNRRHSAQQAADSIDILKNVGFNNISADLIYGLPGLSHERWKQNLDKLFELDIQHISAYHLSIEAGTVFAHFLDKGKIKIMDDEESFQQFQTLISEAKQRGFIHYEISNFGKENYFSKHNSAYWQQKKYLGLGPSAHSFNTFSRQWNVSNIHEYIEKINLGSIPCEIEILTKQDLYNDYIMIALRTSSGINIRDFNKKFGNKATIQFLETTEKYKISGHIKLVNDHICLTDEGMFISDKIISDLFEIH